MNILWRDDRYFNITIEDTIYNIVFLCFVKYSNYF